MSPTWKRIKVTLFRSLNLGKKKCATVSIEKSLSRKDLILNRK